MKSKSQLFNPNWPSAIKITIYIAITWSLFAWRQICTFMQKRKKRLASHITFDSVFCSKWKTRQQQHCLQLKCARTFFFSHQSAFFYLLNMSACHLPLWITQHCCQLRLPLQHTLWRFIPVFSEPGNWKQKKMNSLIFKFYKSKSSSRCTIYIKAHQPHSHTILSD